MTQKIALNGLGSGMTDYTMSKDTQYAEIIENMYIDQDGKPITRDGIEVLRSYSLASGYSILSAQGFNFQSVSTELKNVFFGKLKSATDGRIYYGDLSSNSLSNMQVHRAASTVQYINSSSDADATADIYFAKFGDHLLITGGNNRKPVFATYTTAGTWSSLHSFGMPMPVDEGNTIPGRGNALPSGMTIAATYSETGTANNRFTYLFYIVLKRVYFANGKRFEQFGRAVKYRFTASNQKALTNFTYSDLKKFYPCSVQTPGDQEYGIDASSCYLQIYRSTNGGSTPYFLTEVSLATLNAAGAPYSLNEIALFGALRTDAYLSTSAIPYYAVGGIVENDQIGDRIGISQDNDTAPQFIEVTNAICYLGRFLGDNGALAGVSTTIYGRNTKRVRFSKPGQFYAFPNDFFEDFENDVEAMGAVNAQLVVFNKTKMYRLEGQREVDGSGVTRQICISETIGCSWPRTLKASSDGKLLYFLGNVGPCVTNGGTPQQIGKQLRNTWLAVQKNLSRSVFGYNVIKDCIELVLNDATTSSVSKVYVAHCFAADQNNMHPFTRKAYYDSAQNTFIPKFAVQIRTTLNSETFDFLFYMDASGVLIYEKNGMINDRNISAPSTTYPIRWKIRTLDLMLTDMLGKNWLVGLWGVLSGAVDAAIDIKTYIDKRTTSKALKGVLYDGADGELVEFKRTFKRSNGDGSGGLMAKTVKIELTNGDVSITSESIGTVNISAVQYNNPSGYSAIRTLTRTTGTWPQQLVGANISTGAYSRKVVAINTAGTVATIYDPGLDFFGLGSTSSGTATAQAWSASEVSSAAALKLEELQVEFDTGETPMDGSSVNRNA